MERPVDLGKQRNAVRHVACWLALMLLLGTGGRLVAEPDSRREYQLKAAFLFNFLKFVEWPAAQSGGTVTNTPIVIGVFGGNHFGADLRKVLEGRQIHGRPVVVREIDSAEAARHTHLLFVSESEDSRLDELLPALQREPVLTVGESDAFFRGGGTINFVIEGDKIRFDINMAAAEKAGLKLSAQLLKLARKVKKND